MKHIFVINPVSGHQNAVELIPIIEAYFKDRQNEFEIKVTQYPKHATEIAASYHVSDEVLSMPVAVMEQPMKCSMG